VPARGGARMVGASASLVDPRVSIAAVATVEDVSLGLIWVSPETSTELPQGDGARELEGERPRLLNAALLLSRTLLKNLEAGILQSFLGSLRLGISERLKDDMILYKPPLTSQLVLSYWAILSKKFAAVSPTQNEIDSACTVGL